MRSVKASSLASACLRVVSLIQSSFVMSSPSAAPRCDVRARRRLEVLDELLHPPLGLGREVLLDVDLADGLAERPVRGVDGALPQRLLLLGAREHATVEVEVLELERRRECPRNRVDEAPPHVRLPAV